MTELAVTGGELVPARSARRPGRFVSRFFRSPTAVVGLVLVSLVVVVSLLTPVIAPGRPFSFANPVLAPPSWDHPMGTDNGGVDLFKAVVRGLRTSMTVVAWVVVMSSLIGIALGLAAGYAGGLVDDAVSRIAELVQSVPRFFLALLVVALYGPGIDKIIVILGLTSWTFLTRVVRAETLSVKQRPFIEGARAAGASASRIVVRHILPNVLPRATVVVMLMASRVILIEAGLAFLGLGDPTDPSLGVLANNAQQFLRLAWWMSFFPGVAIVTAVLGMNLLSDGFNQALDPQEGVAIQRSGRRLRRAT